MLKGVRQGFPLTHQGYFWAVHVWLDDLLSEDLIPSTMPLPPSAPSLPMTVDPFRVHPLTRFPTSTSAPLAGTQQQRRDGEHVTREPGASEDTVPWTSKDEINSKVHAMVAASETLKPPLAQGVSLPGPKKSRFVTKMTSAWDRFHSKATSPEPNNLGKKDESLQWIGTLQLI